MEDLKQISHFRFWPKKGNANSLSFFQSQLCFTSDLRLTFPSELQIRQGTSVFCDSSPHFLLIGCTQLWKKLLVPSFEVRSLLWILWHVFWWKLRLWNQLGTITALRVFDYKIQFVPFLCDFVTERRVRLTRWGSWDPAEFLCQFSTVRFCENFPQWAFVHFHCQDLWISKFRICELLQRGFVGRFISCGGAGWCHTQPLLYRWISMSICHEYLLTSNMNIHEYLPWTFVNKQHLTTEYPWIFAMNTC